MVDFQDNTHPPVDVRIKALSVLGDRIRQALCEEGTPDGEFLSEAIRLAKVKNQWFSLENSRAALQAAADWLTEDSLREWLDAYQDKMASAIARKVGIVMAGNLPMVGFHDLLAVVATGNVARVKLSSQDEVLIPALHKMLEEIHPEVAGQMQFVEEKLTDMDAVIATGSNNTARYFEHYFGKYPNIIRKNRTSVAVLNGDESQEELAALGTDIFQYFGLGCRSVSKLFLPEGYSLDTIFEALFSFKHLLDNNKYANNYTYNRAVWLMGQTEFLDNGFFLLKEDQSLHSPVAAAYYEFYSSNDQLLDRLAAEKENIQCVVSRNDIPFGSAQSPGLAEYADGVDTVEWLLDIQ